ncbi:MAG: 2-polyprenyl-3-methyl-6-methoxy-1,4-benzoquinone monooxygenase [Mariprofundaceae bacterium]|nr:2-polyprenyl-3-methyl-6-methoxy-1,4-benzoquinone monooxygenase [Mariprofundaceae bacterium]
MPTFRRYTLADRVIAHVDFALNNVFCEQQKSRPYPAEALASEVGQPLSEAAQASSAAMMRVNHAGEMAAQALYQGQALTARQPEIREQLKQASIEEADHLNWCRQRLDELDAKPSKLDPLWYAGSLAIGVGAGVAGDKWNLGFLAETEHQVVRHLDGHLNRLSPEDKASRAIMTQMKEDELGHAHLAEDLGAAELPKPAKMAMRLIAKVMTGLAARV